jgi:adenine-specific DNA-methyltransferase
VNGYVLGNFLRRELDFYIKNEVMYLDDVDSRPADYLEKELRKIKAIRVVAHDLIDFLAQFEDFQKRLWLKKKFVIETNWCITLDRVPEELYGEIAGNDAQRDEWVRLFAINEIKATPGDLVTHAEPGYSVPLTIDFLKANDKLVLDTALFSPEFKRRLLASIEDIDGHTDGLLVHSENFQALNLFQSRYREQVKCIYIDPPYNTRKDRFPYRDGYPHSSWLAMIEDRLEACRALLRSDGVLWSSIDKNEAVHLDIALSNCLGRDNRIGDVVWRNARDNNPTRIATEHEFLLCYAKSAADTEQVWKNEFADAKELLLAAYQNLKEKGLPPSAIQTELRQFIRDNKALLSEVDRYKFVDENGVFTGSQSVHNPHPGGYEYDIPHPVTGKPMRLPATGYRFPEATMQRDYVEKNRLLYGPDENRIVQIKLKLDEYKDSLRSVIDLDGRLGAYALSALFGAGASDLFENPKPPQLLERLLAFSSLPEALVVDFFAGSGATGEAALAVARQVGTRMKYVLVDMADYFDTVLMPRIQKVVYSAHWKDGKPTARDTGVSHCFKYIRLESYEDALNNLTLDDRSVDVLGLPEDVQDDYLLRYSLDVETRSSLLDLERFENPFDYKLKVYNRETGEAEPRLVDLPETFNYLLGLRVRTMQMREGFLVIEGENPAAETILVIWRNVHEKDNIALEAFVTGTLRINPADTEYAAIYINGDTTLDDPHKKILLTEQVFHELMFDVKEL